MKWIKLLIIVLSLSLPIHSYACWDDDWDDDDSGWYDDWDDDDDDWWNNDDDDDWDGGNDDWWDDDDDVGSWTNTDEKNNPNAPDYWKNQTWHVPAYNEYLLNWKKWENYPEHWWPQNGKNCVSVALEYVANCLEGNYLEENSYVIYREYFESLYLQAFGRDLFQLGADPSHLSSFYGMCGFDVENISSKDVQSCILDNTPVIGVIASGENSAHELFIIGYFADTDMYQTLNPTTGTFQAFDKNDFYGNSLYKVNGFK